MWSYRLPKFEEIRDVTHERLSLLVSINPENQPISIHQVQFSPQMHW